MVGLCLLAAWSGWRLAGTGPDERPERSHDEVPAVSIGPDQRAVWVSYAFNPMLLGLALALLAATVALGALAILGFPAGLWIAVVAVAVAGLVGVTLSAVRVQVDDRALVIAYGPLRRPVRRIPLDEIDGAWVEDRRPAQVGGWGYRIVPGGTTIMIRRGECLVVRLSSGRELAVTVDDAGRGAALLNTLLASASGR